MVKEKIRYCRDCGAFIPAWSDKCLSCGYDDLKPKERKSGAVNLERMSEVVYGGLRLRNVYISSANVEFGNAGAAVLELRIVGDVVRNRVDGLGSIIYDASKGCDV